MYSYWSHKLCSQAKIDKVWFYDFDSWYTSFKLNNLATKLTKSILTVIYNYKRVINDCLFIYMCANNFFYKKGIFTLSLFSAYVTQSWNVYFWQNDPKQ